jgi:hypothetical protein
VPKPLPEEDEDDDAPPAPDVDPTDVVLLAEVVPFVGIGPPSAHLRVPS